MDSNVTNILKNAAVKFGIPFEILYAVVMTESGGNPNSHALTSKEDSRGLFQVNIKAHPDANSGQLFNPEYNANYWVPQLVPSYKQGLSKGLSGADLAAYVERYGERPAWTSAVDSSIRKHYADITGGKVTTGGQLTESKLQNSQGVYTEDGGILADVVGGVTGTMATILDTVKFYLAYGVLFVLLIFSLYMVFVKGEK